MPATGISATEVGAGKPNARHGRTCPAIHVIFRAAAPRTWMPGTRPGMTAEKLDIHLKAAHPFFGPTLNVALARAMATPSAFTKHCAKQIVLPVLITSVSAASP